MGFLWFRILEVGGFAINFGLWGCEITGFRRILGLSWFRILEAGAFAIILGFGVVKWSLGFVLRWCHPAWYNPNSKP